MMNRNFDFAFIFNEEQSLNKRKSIYDKYANMYESLLYKKSDEPYGFTHPIRKEAYVSQDFIEADGFYVGEPLKKKG